MARQDSITASQSRNIGRRRRSSSSNSSKSGKLDGDTLPVIPTQCDSASEEHLKRVLGLTNDTEQLQHESFKLERVPKNGILSSEKGNYNFFTPKEESAADKLTAEDFEKALQTAVETIKEISVTENMETNMGSISENVTKTLRDFKSYNKEGGPNKFTSPETVFKEVVSELFPNTTEKFTIGSSQPASGKKYSGPGKLSPKSNKHSNVANGLYKNAKSNMRSMPPSFLSQTSVPMKQTFNFSPTNDPQQSKHFSSFNPVENAKTRSSAQESVMYNSAGFPKIRQMILSDNPALQLEGTKNFRQLIAIKRDAIPQNVLSEDILPRLLQSLKQPTFLALQVEALWALTNLAAGSSIQTQLLVKNNAVPILVDLLKTNNREILEQTVWVLGNIAGEDISTRDVVLQAGALPILLSWMNCCVDPSADVRLPPNGTELQKQGAGGNLAPDQLKPGFESPIQGNYPDFNLEPLTSQTVVNSAKLFGGDPARPFTPARDASFGTTLRIPNYKNFLKIASWTLSNLCDGQPRPEVEILSILNTVRILVYTVDDDEVLSHVCWALSHLCDGSSVYIEQVVRSQICAKLVHLLSSKAWRVVKPALRTVGNIVCAEDEQDYTQHIIDCGAIPLLKKLIDHQHKEIQKEACWTISNISAGSVPQIQRVLDSGAIPQLVRLANSAQSEPDDISRLLSQPEQVSRVRKSKQKSLVRKGKAPGAKVNSTLSPSCKSGQVDPDVRIEACWVLLNATSCGNESQIVELVKAGCVQVLCSLLSDSSMVLMALEGVEKVLHVGQDIGRRNAALPKKQEGSSTKANKNLGEKQVEDDVFNPHAILLDTKKIEALQKHRSSAIAKRAKRIWKHHFVECAICSKAYSKHAKVADFCPECKCYVCRSCDCTKFHLSYQDKIWSQIIDDEEKNNKKEKAGKKDKSKRQKKREKDKKRKMLQKEKHKQEKADKGAQKHQAKEHLSKADSGKQNEQYVDFLLNNGSILALWNLMNENEAHQV